MKPKLFILRLLHNKYFFRKTFFALYQFFMQGIHSHTQFHPAVISVSAIVNAIIQALEPEPEVTTTGDLFYL